MSSYRTVKPNVSMKEKAARGPGVGVHEAVAAATAGMEALRNDAMTRVDAIVVRLSAMRGTNSGAAPAEMRRLADELAGLCGAFGLAEVGAAAASLCRLLDLGSPGPAGTGAVLVHLDALHLLARMETKAGTRAAGDVLAGLRQVVSASEAGSGSRC